MDRMNKTKKPTGYARTIKNSGMTPELLRHFELLECINDNLCTIVLPKCSQYPAGWGRP